MYKNTKVTMAAAVAGILALAVVAYAVPNQAQATLMGDRNHHKNNINVAIGGAGGIGGSGGAGGSGANGGTVYGSGTANGGTANGGNGGSANGGNACNFKCNSGTKTFGPPV